jgi:uncharacterized tellurite resistance protein B-like protein
MLTFLADGVQNLGEKLKVLKRELMEDGHLDLDEIRFLSELRTLAGKRAKAKKVAVDPAFDVAFFKLLYDQLMADGQIDRAEAGWLREVLFQDGKIDANEKAFLQKLKRAAKGRTSTEFEKLYEECMSAR